MKRNNLKSLIAIGAFAFASTAAQAQQTGAPVAGLVANLLGNVTQNLGQVSLASSISNLGQGALTNNLGNLGQGALSGNLNNSLNGSLNGLLSSGDRGARTSTLVLQGVGDIGGGTLNVNALNGNTRLARSGNTGGAQ